MSKNIIISDQTYGVLKDLSARDKRSVYDEMDYIIICLIRMGKSLEEYVKSKKEEQDGRKD